MIKKLKRKKSKQKTILKKPKSKILKKKKEYLWLVRLQFDGDIQKVLLQKTGKKGYWVKKKTMWGKELVEVYVKKTGNNVEKIFNNFEEAKQCYVNYLKNRMKQQSKRLKNALKLSQW